jgi:HEAT repeat protein
MGQLNATTLGVLAAACVLLLAVGHAGLRVLRSRRARHSDGLARRCTPQLDVSASAEALPQRADDPDHLLERLGLADPSLAAIDMLSSLLRAGSEDERIGACRALSRIARAEVRPLLVEALADDAWAVRAEAARGLTGVGDVSSVPELERALSDGAWWVRANAAEALRSIGPAGLDALVRASQGGNRVTAAPARQALALEGAGDDPDDGDLGLAA